MQRLLNDFVFNCSSKDVYLVEIEHYINKFSPRGLNKIIQIIKCLCVEERQKVLEVILERNKLLGLMILDYIPNPGLDLEKCECGSGLFSFTCQNYKGFCISKNDSWKLKGRVFGECSLNMCRQCANKCKYSFQWICPHCQYKPTILDKLCCFQDKRDICKYKCTDKFITIWKPDTLKSDYPKFWDHTVNLHGKDYEVTVLELAIYTIMHQSSLPSDLVDEILKYIIHDF